MEKGYYKPRKTIIDKSEQKKPVAKNDQPKKIVKTPVAKKQLPKETKTPAIKPVPKEKPNIVGGYSKRVTYPENQLNKGTSGLQKGGGKIGGYIKPKTMDHNPMGKIIWVLLAIFVVAVIFAALFFTNSLDKFGIGGVRLGSQDLEMKISNVQIENDSIDLKVDIEAGESDLVGVKIIIDDGYNFDVFKVELTKEEIEKGEIHLELDKVDGDRITKILISPILNTEEREGVVGSVEESYIPKKTDFISKKDINNYNDPQNKYYPYNSSQLKNKIQNQTQNQIIEQIQNQTQNQTNLNQTINNQTTVDQTTNETTNETQNDFDDPSCTDNNLSICYQESVYHYNACSDLWVVKQECALEEVCITNECILREEVIPECGNGILEVGEYCEEGTLAGETCEGFGYISGTLTCNPNCAFNLDLCLEPGQDCTADCENKDCGSDGCGGICGDCTSEEECGSEGVCVPRVINNPCWFIENGECVAGDDEVTCDRDVIYSSMDECETHLEPISDPCWFIENNLCEAGDDEVTCDRDLIYTSLEACEQDLIPEGCSPLETDTYICIEIQESDPGYNTLIQGGTACGHCANSAPGEVVISGTDYYCQCPIPGVV